MTVRVQDILPTTIGTTNTVVLTPNFNRKVQALVIQNRSTGTQTITVKLNGTDATAGTGLVLEPDLSGNGNGAKLALSINEGYQIPHQEGVAVVGSAASAIYSAHIEVVS